MLVSKIKEILTEIERTLSIDDRKNKLPENTYYLSDGKILCCPRKNGESRYPYSYDGYTLWAYSSGHIHVKDGLLNVFKPVFDYPEPQVSFFAGIEQADGTFFPVSILGGTQQLFEPFKVKRYLVYAPGAAYYIADTDFAVFAIRADISKRKEIRFSFAGINKIQKPVNICLTTYINPLLKNDEYDDMWTKTKRVCRYYENGSFVCSRNDADYHSLVINRRITNSELKEHYYTTLREDFVGYTNCSVMNAECLKTGKFEKQTVCAGNVATPIASEILHFTLNDYVRVDYVMPITHKEGFAESLINNEIDIHTLDNEIEQFEIEEKERLSKLNIQFENLKSGKIDADVLNRFIKNVQKQVDFCAMGRCYVEDMLGTRDVFQQLEQAIIWDPKQAREKIIRAISFIDPSGIPPRQFSVPEDSDTIPKVDLRKFIDQGNWIISCVYSYIAWTNDYSILDEICGYYEIIGENKVKLSDIRDSVFNHLLKITDYLESNLDYEDGTNCLKILYGDWNDAIDGLGRTKDEVKKFGTGVSVMASLHFYQNLFEMSEILKVVGGYEEKEKRYLEIRDILAEGLIKNAVDVNKNGEKRLIHGWGDHSSYKLGSFCDSDKKSRISFAPNAFWASSGLVYKTPEFKQLIIDTLHSLDSQFGLKTLTPYFAKGCYGVGRIATTLPGTAENDCVYIHASMFSIIALFLLGDSEYAWNQVEKTITITHDKVSKTPFVMSNSYLENEEHGLCGQSAIDWYTGAGTVFIKNIVRYVIGINPDLNGVRIQTASYMPCNKLKTEIYVKGYKVYFEYKNENTNNRKIYLDGKEISAIYDNLMETKVAYISDKDLYDGAKIAVCD